MLAASAAVGPIRLSVVEVLERRGGVASRRSLIEHVSAAELRRALEVGDVVRVARGRYALAALDEARLAAERLGGVLCLTQAAIHHGWPVKRATGPVHVLVPKHRRASAAAGVVLHRADLKPHQIDGCATGVEVTLDQCLRQLPFDEALTIADSALRAGLPDNVLHRLAAGARGPGARQVSRVAGLASRLAANPFESVTRAIAADVPGLTLTPQVWVTDTARADLVDERLRIVVEADSFAWHGQRDQLKADARRYNLMVIEGWLVLRFTWEDVMLDPDYVRNTLAAAVALAELRTKAPRKRRNGPTHAA